MRQKPTEVAVLSPWDELEYDEALNQQSARALAGGHGWLLFCCRATITLGKRGHFSDVLMPMSELRRLGVRLLPVARGGEVTYHGPGQIIGFPFGTLEGHTGDPRGVRRFVSTMKTRLEKFIAAELVHEGDTARKIDPATAEDCAGIWLIKGPERRKIVSIGLGFNRTGISHGFALNVQPMQDGFELVNPCGEIGARPASLYTEKKSEAQFLATLGRLTAILGEP